jgi:hypothetical protein
VSAPVLAAIAVVSFLLGVVTHRLSRPRASLADDFAKRHSAGPYRTAAKPAPTEPEPPPPPAPEWTFTRHGTQYDMLICANHKSGVRLWSQHGTFWHRDDGERLNTTFALSKSVDEAWTAHQMRERIAKAVKS